MHSVHCIQSMIMEVPAPGKGFHLLWPGTILWLINSETDCAKCSPWAQVLISSKEIPQRSLLQERTVIDWMTIASWRKWPRFRQLSRGIGGYYFKCFLNNCHWNVMGLGALAAGRRRGNSAATSSVCTFLMDCSRFDEFAFLRSYI